MDKKEIYIVLFPKFIQSLQTITVILVDMSFF